MRCSKLSVGLLVQGGLGQCSGSLEGLGFLELGTFSPCTGFVLPYVVCRLDLEEGNRKEDKDLAVGTGQLLQQSG